MLGIFNATVSYGLSSPALKKCIQIKAFGTRLALGRVPGESSQARFFGGIKGYSGVEVQDTIGTFCSRRDSPVMDKEEAEAILDDFAQYLEEQIIAPAVEEISSAIESPAPPLPKHHWEMLGEYLREAAVLVLILVPIDLLIPRAINGQKPIGRQWVVLTLATSFLLLVGGMWAEGRKKVK